MSNTTISFRGTSIGASGSYEFPNSVMHEDSVRNISVVDIANSWKSVFNDHGGKPKTITIRGSILADTTTNLDGAIDTLRSKVLDQKGILSVNQGGKTYEYEAMAQKVDFSNRSVSAISFSVTFIANPGMSNPSESIIEYQEDFNVDAVTFGTIESSYLYVAQTFVAKSNNVSKIEVYLKRTNSFITNDVQVDICQVDGSDNPDLSKVIGSCVVDSSSVLDSYSFIPFDFGFVNLDIGTTYAFVVRMHGKIRILTSTTGLYQGYEAERGVGKDNVSGVFKNYSLNGSWGVENSTYHLTYRIYSKYTNRYYSVQNNNVDVISVQGSDGFIKLRCGNNVVFGGDDERIKVPTAVFAGLAKGSLCMWARRDSLVDSSRQLLFREGSLTNDFSVFSLELNGQASNKLRAFVTTDNNTNTISGDVTVDHDGWFHVAVVYNGANVVVYLNGTPGTSTAATGSLLDDFNKTTVGAYRYSDGLNSFNGYIAMVRGYDIELTQDMVNQDMNGKVNYAYTNLEYEMDEYSLGSSVTDSSGSNNTGVLEGGASWYISPSFSDTEITFIEAGSKLTISEDIDVGDDLWIDLINKKVYKNTTLIDYSGMIPDLVNGQNHINIKTTGLGVKKTYIEIRELHV